MPTPKKTPVKKISWWEYAFGLASRSAGNTWAEMKTQYLAGKSGQPAPTRRATGPEPKRVGPAWWEVLGVGRGVSLAEVTAAYRDRIRQNHPDKVAHLSEKIRRVADEETRRLNAAYAQARQALSGKA